MQKNLQFQNVVLLMNMATPSVPFVYNQVRDSVAGLLSHSLIPSLEFLNKSAFMETKVSPLLLS